MKKILLFSILLVLILSSVDAQNPKRFLFFEHFTNSVCEICSTKNPPFFDKISAHPNDVHHISIHPPIPYTSCEFYRDNTFENTELAINYEINGTPKLYLWGNYVTTNVLLPDAELESALGQTSPISVNVSETGTTERTVDVAVNAFEDLPTGENYRLLVAMVERKVDYIAPNGETVHHNVFREMLTSVNGEAMPALSNGEVFNFNSTYAVSTNYVESEMYAVAWVRIPSTKEVLNSGSSRSSILSSTNEEKLAEASIFIYPNPTKDVLSIDLGDNDIQKIELINTNGKVAMVNNQPEANSTMNIGHLATGVYFVNLISAEGTITKKIMKF